MAAGAQHFARLEHERHGVVDLVRFEVVGDSLFRRGVVRAVSAHAVMQGRAARGKAFSLGIVGTVDQAKESSSLQNHIV